MTIEEQYEQTRIIESKNAKNIEGADKNVWRKWLKTAIKNYKNKMMKKCLYNLQ